MEIQISLEITMSTLLLYLFKKAIFNQNINFGEKNLIHVVGLHDDALVIVSDVCKF